MPNLNQVFQIGLLLLAGVLPVSIAGSSLVMFPLFAGWILTAPWNADFRMPKWTLMESVFLLFFVTGLISGLLGNGIGRGWHDLQKDLYFLMAPLLLAMVRDRAQALKLLNVFVVAAVITAAFGIAQYVIGIDQIDQNGQIFIHVPMWLSHLPRWALRLLSMNNTRVQGTRSHPLNYSEVLVLAAALTVSRALVAEPADARRTTVMSWVIVLALLLSKSRGPWLGCAAATLAAAAIVLTRHPSRSVVKRLLILAAPVLFFGFMPVLRARAGSIARTAGNEERLHMWKMGVAVFREHPLFGVGPGGVKPASIRFQTPEERALGAWGHLHSTYMNFAAERGLVGLLAFAALIVVFFLELARGFDPWDSQVTSTGLGGLLALIGFLVFGLTETAYDSTTVLMSLYFVLGVSLSVIHPPREPS